MNKLMQEVMRIRKTDKVFKGKQTNAIALSMKKHLEKTW